MRPYILDGRMLLSPYLPGLQRAECPVFQVSRTANRELFDKYWIAIQEIQRRSTEIRK